MFQDLYLWEDLGVVHDKTHQAVEMLQTLLQSVREGQLDLPTREDSQHLNRLMVLADLFCSELRAWADANEKNGAH